MYAVSTTNMSFSAKAGSPIKLEKICRGTKSVPRGRRMRINENESKNEKHGDKSECVYDNVKIKIESKNFVNTRLVCSVRVRGCCSAYM